MKKKSYKNPNKFLISNGKFIRNFELMYKKIRDPWNQKKDFFSGEQYLFLFSYINFLNNKFKKNKNVLDVGAGSGQLKKMLNKNLSIWVQIFIKKNLKMLYMMTSMFLINLFKKVSCDFLFENNLLFRRQY